MHKKNWTSCQLRHSLKNATRILPDGMLACKRRCINAAKCEPDKQGRFLIPAELRQYAGLSSEVTFIGQGGHAEIWDSAAYDELEQQTLTPENLAAVMEELGF